MNKMFGYALTWLVGIGMGASISANVSANNLHVQDQGTNAAYRDGLYMGKHDAELGRLHHVAIGRWNTATDRAEYQAGYDAGFGPVNHVR